MWVNRKLFELILADNKRQGDELEKRAAEIASLQTSHTDALAQKAKDDISIDWMRHRINALEKHNAILLAKAAGIHVPVPEIVPTRPGTISAIPNFDTLPSFEDVGDEQAAKLGIVQDDLGNIAYDTPESVFAAYKRLRAAGQ